MVLYGEVEKRLKRAKIPYDSVYHTDNIPPEKI